MTAIPEKDGDEPSVPKPVMRRFRSAASVTRLAPDVTARHSRVTTAAFLTLGGAAAATAFLNGHDEALGGRPLDIAGASPDGLSAVEEAMRVRVAG